MRIMNTCGLPLSGTAGVARRQQTSLRLPEQKLTLARRLERLRDRYRRAVLSNWHVLARVVETFERVQAGNTPVDPLIDVIASLGLSREKILARLPYHLRTLRHLMKGAAA